MLSLMFLLAVAEIVGWLVANVGTLLTIAGAVVGVASMVTALTPSPKDDLFVSKVKGYLDRLSVLTHKDAAGTVKLPLTKSKPQG